VISVTPGPHGWCPRDLHLQWSAASPLERELLPLEEGRYEAISEYARRLFKQYREVKVRVLDHLKRASEARALLANRFRKESEYKVGDRVVYRTPKARTEGRTPWKRVLSGPFIITAVKGNRVLMVPEKKQEKEDAARAVQDDVDHEHGKEDKDKDKKDKTIQGHMEDLIKCPVDLCDLEYERQRLTLDATEPAEGAAARQRSIGQILKNTGLPKQQSMEVKRRGKQYVLRVGEYIAYAPDDRRHICTIGKVVRVMEAEESVSVHRMGPESSGFRAHWQPLYIGDRSNSSALGFAGTQPVLER
jgi:hypothetical protein